MAMIDTRTDYNCTHATIDLSQHFAHTNIATQHEPTPSPAYTHARTRSSYILNFLPHKSYLKSSFKEDPEKIPENSKKGGVDFGK